MTRILGYKLWILVLIGVVLIPAGALGQAISGDLVGTVYDASRAVIPNATVVVVNEATNAKASTVTNASGEYRFTNLLVGKYDLTVSATGFGGTTLKAIPVELNKTATANVSLEVGKLATTLEVTGAAPLIHTTTAQVETTYETKQVQDLPSASIGLGVINLSLLQAGVTSSGGLGAARAHRLADNVRGITTLRLKAWTTTTRVSQGRRFRFRMMQCRTSLCWKTSSARSSDTPPADSLTR